MTTTHSRTIANWSCLAETIGHLVGEAMRLLKLLVEGAGAVLSASTSAKFRLKETLLTAFLVAAPSVAAAIPIPISPVGAPAVNCVFSTSCTLTVTDTTSPITFPDAAGTGFLQSRTFSGEPGTQGEGLTGYEYRIDLREIRGSTFVPCVGQFIIDFGPGSSLDYDGDGDLERVYVVTSGGLGSVGPSSADKTGNIITFEFAPSLCAGESSFFFGLASPRPPRFVTAELRTREGETLALQARVPEAPPSPCQPRPDLNDDLTAGQRLTLATAMQDFLTGPVLNMHLTTPGIHGSSLFLPWHRDYLADLENFLVAGGHSEFVPLPKWDPAKPIPDEFHVVDSDCSEPPTCAALANTNPGLALPSNLSSANICSNYSTAEALRLGPPSPGLERWHNGVHGRVGGAMGDFNSPAAVVFWPWHAMVDDVWRTWQCCPGRILPFATRDLLARPCLIAPCWPLWLGFDDLRLSASAPLQVKDRRGFDNQGLVVGDPMPVPGMVGGALAFDGVDDHVRVPTHPELDVGTGDFSIDAWVRTTALGFQPIGSRAGAFSLFLQDGRLGFSFGLPVAEFADDRAFVADQGNVADGAWHHVAVAVDRDGPGTLFVDSLPVLRFDASGFQGDLQGTGDLVVARDAATGALFRGAIDELDLFRFLLTEPDVDAIFSAGAAGKEGALADALPIAHGDCLEALRQLILTVPRLSGLANDSLLVKIDKVIERRRAGDHKGAAHMLRALHQQARGLARKGTFDRGIFMTIEHKAHDCLEAFAGHRAAPDRRTGT